MISAWFRRFLGIYSLHKDVLGIWKDVLRLEEEMLKMRNDLSVTFGDEFDPKRQALSKELGSRMRQKLLGEENARRHMEGKEPLKELPK